MPAQTSSSGWTIHSEKDTGGKSWTIPIHNRSRSNESLFPMIKLGGGISVLKKFLTRQQTSYPQRQPNRLTMKSSPISPSGTIQSNIMFVLMCGLWYTTSALSSNTGKAILIQFRYPITLTFVQFGFVASYCLVFMTPAIQFTRLRSPTRTILRNTFPMGVFQVGGHVFSSMAISRIPVSTVHTIKALSPLFTVAAYALLFGVSYSAKTYISLLPLTVGVMLACSFEVSASNAVGLLCAFGSAIVFVTSNIFFKKIMPSTPVGMAQPPSHKLDKLNLLFYSSGMAFILMIPIWVVYDLPVLMVASSNPDHIAHPHKGHSTPHSVGYYFFMNGTVHFAQNLIAFIILSSTSPVTYSIASLIKRVAVICIAIVWFSQTVHPIQAFGIAMTFLGLYMYNNAKADVEKGENKMRRVEAAHAMILPSTNAESRMMSGVETPPDIVPASASGETTKMDIGSVSAYERPRGLSLSVGAHHHSRNPLHFQSHPTSGPISAKIAPPSQRSDSKVSPIKSYPSPPPSLDDSPPLTTVPLASAELDGQARLEDIQRRLGPALKQIEQQKR